MQQASLNLRPSKYADLYLLSGYTYRLRNLSQNIAKFNKSAYNQIKSAANQLSGNYFKSFKFKVGVHLKAILIHL